MSRTPYKGPLFARCAAELEIRSRGARSGVSACVLPQGHERLEGERALHLARFTVTTGDDRVVRFAEAGARYSVELRALMLTDEP